MVGGKAEAAGALINRSQIERRSVISAARLIVLRPGAADVLMAAGLDRLPDGPAERVQTG